ALQHSSPSSVRVLLHPPPLAPEQHPGALQLARGSSCDSVAASCLVACPAQPVCLCCRGHLQLRGDGGPPAHPPEGHGHCRPGHPQNCERYLNWAHAFLVVYSVDSRQSFEGSSSYLELLALHAKETQRCYPALLLGNKLDMAQYSSDNSERLMSQSHDAGVKMSWRKVRSCGPSDWPPCLPLPPIWSQPWPAGSAASSSRSPPAWTSSMCSTCSMRRCGKRGGSWSGAPRPGPSSSLRTGPPCTRCRSRPGMGWPAALSTRCPPSA
ncbi:uncharacterized protein LOC134474763, partial [Cavia porcellus]|uniref:uncharacterized protein LOC134474763 n=1 Tax=Cavia porcellus TaxID=10141 RepID=UPI002FE07C98